MPPKSPARSTCKPPEQAATPPGCPHPKPATSCSATTNTAHQDPGIRLGIARADVAGKIRNSRRVLIHAAADAVPALPDADSLDQVMDIEVRAARVYFAPPRLFMRTSDDFPSFTSRSRRPPTDSTNALCSFLYGLLRQLAHSAAEQVGLDPYLGFLHGLRPAKPALALDLMEVLRSPLRRPLRPHASEPQVAAPQTVRIAARRNLATHRERPTRRLRRMAGTP